MAIEFRNPVIKFISSITTLLCVFILTSAHLFIYSILYPPKYANMIYYVAFILELVFYCVVSYLILRQNKIAFYIMIGILAIYGLSSVVFGFVISISQYILKTYGIVIGLYWLYGVFILYSHIKSLSGENMRGRDCKVAKL